MGIPSQTPLFRKHEQATKRSNKPCQACFGPQIPTPTAGKLDVVSPQTWSRCTTPELGGFACPHWTTARFETRDSFPTFIQLSNPSASYAESVWRTNALGRLGCGQDGAGQSFLNGWYNSTRSLRTFSQVQPIGAYLPHYSCPHSPFLPLPSTHRTADMELRGSKLISLILLASGLDFLLFGCQ